MKKKEKPSVSDNRTRIIVVWIEFRTRVAKAVCRSHWNRESREFPSAWPDDLCRSPPHSYLPAKSETKRAAEEPRRTDSTEKEIAARDGNETGEGRGEEKTSAKDPRRLRRSRGRQRERENGWTDVTCRPRWRKARYGRCFCFPRASFHEAALVKRVSRESSSNRLRLRPSEAISTETTCMCMYARASVSVWILDVYTSYLLDWSWTTTILVYHCALPRFRKIDRQQRYFVGENWKMSRITFVITRQPSR